MDRLTRKSVGVFQYVLKEHKPVGPEFIFMSWTEKEIVLRDRYEENNRTNYWRA